MWFSLPKTSRRRVLWVKNNLHEYRDTGFFLERPEMKFKTDLIISFISFEFFFHAGLTLDTFSSGFKVTGQISTVRKKSSKVFMELFCTLPWSRLFGVWWSKTQSVSRESFPCPPHLSSNQTCLISSQVFSLAFGVELKTQWQHVFRCERLSNIDLLKVFKILSKSPRVWLASAT